MKKINKVLFYIFEFIILLIIFTSIYIKQYFSEATLDQILFHLTTPLEGASNNFFINGLKFVLPYSLIMLIVILLLFLLFKNYDLIIIYNKKKKYNLFKFLYNRKRYFIILSIIITLVELQTNLGVITYIFNLINSSKIYEDNYVEVNNNIDLTDTNNLILIYAESLETTDFSTKNGGYRTNSLIPEMEELYNENINFGNNYNQIYGTQWTIAGMISSSSGINLKVSYGNDFYDEYGDNLYAGLISIGDILEDNDYNQTFIMGSDSTFAGRNTYLKTHGNYKIIDYNSLIDMEYIDSDYYVNWGAEDSIVFEAAKDEITSLAKENNKFNVSILTTDTHPTDGYIDEKYCEKDNNLTDYENAFKCNSSIIYDFIKWVEEQDFYEDTTIVIIGDHLNMYSENIHDNLDEDYNRGLYNVVINSKIEKECENHSYSTVDLFPTILEAIGTKIEGRKLGLGTSLYSCEKTIIEEYGLDNVQSELLKHSKYYDKCLVKNCEEDN